MLHFFFFSLLIHFEEKQPMYHHTIFESMIRIQKSERCNIDCSSRQMFLFRFRLRETDVVHRTQTDRQAGRYTHTHSTHARTYPHARSPSPPATNVCVCGGGGGGGYFTAYFMTLTVNPNCVQHSVEVTKCRKSFVSGVSKVVLNELNSLLVQSRLMNVRVLFCHVIITDIAKARDQSEGHIKEFDWSRWVDILMVCIIVILCLFVSQYVSRFTQAC